MQLLIEIDPLLAKQIEKVAPARSRKRSEFIRMAIRKALWEIEEQATARAYREQPDDEPVHYDPRDWEPLRSRPRRGRAKK